MRRYFFEDMFDSLKYDNAHGAEDDISAYSLMTNNQNAAIPGEKAFMRVNSMSYSYMPPSGRKAEDPLASLGTIKLK